MIVVERTIADVTVEVEVVVAVVVSVLVVVTVDEDTGFSGRTHRARLFISRAPTGGVGVQPLPPSLQLGFRTTLTSPVLERLWRFFGSTQRGPGTFEYGQASSRPTS